MSRYKVYLRNWYYNAGIIGFLSVLSEGERNINTIISNYQNHITISDNYIEVDLQNVLSGFYEKYQKMFSYAKLYRHYY